MNVLFTIIGWGIVNKTSQPGKRSFHDMHRYVLQSGEVIRNCRGTTVCFSILLCLYYHSLKLYNGTNSLRKQHNSTVYVVSRALPMFCCGLDVSKLSLRAWPQRLACK